MKRFLMWLGKRSGFSLVAVTLLAVMGTSLDCQGQTQNQAPRPARSRAEETLDVWNEIGNKLVAMARIFPKTSTGSRANKTRPSPMAVGGKPICSRCYFSCSDSI